MKKYVYFYALCVIIIFLNYSSTYSQTQMSINQMPTGFFGKWYSTDGNNGWAYHITNDFFRTNNILYKYDRILKSGDDYTVNVSYGADYKTFYIKGIVSGYIKIAGSNRQFDLFKNDRNLSDRGSDDDHQSSLISNQITVNQMPTGFFGKWYSTDGNNGWAYHITNDFFRTNNKLYKYDRILKSGDDYTVNVSYGTDYKTFYIKGIVSGYIKIAGSNRQFELFKNDRNLSDRGSDDDHQSSLSHPTGSRYCSNSSDDDHQSSLSPKQNNIPTNKNIIYIHNTSWEYGDSYDIDKDGYKSCCCLTIDIRARENKSNMEKYSGFYKFYYKFSNENNYNLLFTSEIYNNIDESSFGFFRQARIGCDMHNLPHGIYDFKIELFDGDGIIQEIRDATTDINLKMQKIEIYYPRNKREE